MKILFGLQNNFNKNFSLANFVTKSEELKAIGLKKLMKYSENTVARISLNIWLTIIDILANTLSEK